MKAAITTAPGHIEIVNDLEVGEPRAGEVAIRVAYCGLCLTDIHIVEGQIDFPRPAVCGHEVSGVVEAIGEGVSDIHLGNKVVLSCRPPCRSCYFCLRNEPQLCSNSLGWKTGTLSSGETRLSWRNMTVYRGVGVAGFAERVVLPASGAIPIPDDMPLDIASVLGCAVQTGVGAVFNTAKVRPGDTVFVIGLGGVGNAAVQAARCSGAELIIGADPRKDRRTQGMESGADIVLDPTSTDMLAEILEATSGVGVDYSFDAVADPDSTIKPGFASLRPGGLLVVIGVPSAGTNFTVPGSLLVSDERKITGCFLGSADPHREIERLIKLWRRGRIDLEPFVSDHLPLQNLPGLFNGDQNRSNGLRTVISIGEST
jgi:S-(hydroxymethyl)glutathione dehydrogenase/alcohol dehydrogenase